MKFLPVLFLSLTLLISTTFKASVDYTGKSFEQIKKGFDLHNAWGLETRVDLKECNSDLIRSSTVIREYIIQLCDLIDMKRFGDPQIVHFGKHPEVAGYTMQQLIETSNITGHFAEIDDSAYINIFSCKLYDPYIVAIFTKDFFKASTYRMDVSLRL